MIIGAYLFFTVCASLETTLLPLETDLFLAGDFDFDGDLDLAGDLAGDPGFEPGIFLWFLKFIFNWSSQFNIFKFKNFENL